MRAIALLLLLITNMAAATQPQLPSWHLSEQKLLKGPFTQQKKTRFLRRPIQSSGTILLASSHGIAWQTESPVQSTLVITPTHITNIDSDNQRQKLSGGSDLNMVFLNALTGNWSLLQQHFDMNIEQHQQQTCVALTPKPSLSATNLTDIKVCGSEKVIETMQIVESGGAVSDITMSLSPYPQMSETEQQLFANE